MLQLCTIMAEMCDHTDVSKKKTKTQTHTEDWGYGCRFGAPDVWRNISVNKRSDVKRLFGANLARNC